MMGTGDRRPGKDGIGGLASGQIPAYDAAASQTSTPEGPGQLLQLTISSVLTTTRCARWNRQSQAAEAGDAP